MSEHWRVYSRMTRDLSCRLDSLHGDAYRFLFIDSDVHLFGVENGVWFPLGTDIQGATCYHA